MWRDNLELLAAYYLLSKTILENTGKLVSGLDISTGPCLAPLLATLSCLETVLLSDYTESNRKVIQDGPIEYWTRYAAELCDLYPDDGLDASSLLCRLDQLRHREAPLDIDLRRDPVFLPELPVQGFDLLSMHFVVDSICESSAECFSLFAKVLPFVRNGGWLMMSALIDSDGWDLGGVRHPSPRLSEVQIEGFLSSHNFGLIRKVRSQRKPLQTYDGGWTVFLLRRTAE